MGDAYLREHPNPVSRGYTSPRRSEPSGVIGVHTAENMPDYVAFDGGAEAVAHYETIRTTPGSYHDLCDSDSCINLVRYEDAAWHDGTGTNHHSYGLSVATRADVWPLAPRAWRDGAIEQAAQAAARYARWLHKRNGTVIPARRITAAQARNRVPGFVSHAELDPGRRSDPGAGFPWAKFLARYAELVADLLGGATPAPPSQEFTMDAEAKAAFEKLAGEVETLRQEVGAVREVQLIHVDENRKQYGSLRGWTAAAAEAIGTLLTPVKSFRQMRERASELDTYRNPDG